MKTNRREFVRAMAACAAVAACPGFAYATDGASSSKPNVILIMTDDQGYGDLSCLGNKVIKTDAMDKLHSESVRLTNYHVCPTCSPSRSALLTGRNNNRVGVWHTICGRTQLRKDEVTMADVFGDSGYKTGIFGKWHLGDNYPFRPQDRGFQEVLIHGGGGVTQTADYWNNDYFDDTYFHNGKPEKRKGYCTDVWFEGATEFIDANKDKPFFAYITPNAPHEPYLIDPKYIKMYKGKNNVANANYYGMITNIDENIAKLRKHLEDLGIADNTVFIFTTDNGTSVGYGFNAGMRGRKGSEYDGGHRVPMFIHYPDGKLTEPKDIDRITAHVDILPTLVELCDLTETKKVEYDGKSLVPLIYGKGAGWGDRAIVTDSQRVAHPIKWRKSAVMTDRWRLVNGKELYDMKADAGQKKNIAKEHPEVKQKLIGEYDKWWASVSEKFGEYTRTIIGSEHENPVTITTMDWLQLSAWNQNIVRSGKMLNGKWMIDVAESGKYRFELRRYPIESGLGITAVAPAGDVLPGGGVYYKPGKSLKISDARLKVGNADVTKPVGKDAEGVSFEVKLNRGHAEMQTWFMGEGIKKSLGAYYVYVKKL